MYASGYYEALHSEERKGKVPPYGGRVYRFQDLSRLALLDSPGLDFPFEGLVGSIQTAHVTDEQMLAVPGMTDSLWRYHHTTFEWIPEFRYAGTIPITDLVDIRRVRNYDGKPFLWVTPKGHPRIYCIHCDDRGCKECKL